MSREKAPPSNTFQSRLREVFRHFYGKEWGGQRRLNKDTGIATGTISEWFRDDNPTTPDVNSIGRISEALGISYEWLATGKGTMLPEIPTVGALFKPAPAGGAAWFKAIEDLEAALLQRGLTKGIPRERKELLAELLVQGQQAGTPAEVLQRQLVQLVDLLEDSIRKARAKTHPNP